MAKLKINNKIIRLLGQRLEDLTISYNRSHNIERKYEVDRYASKIIGNLSAPDEKTFWYKHYKQCKQCDLRGKAE